MYLGFKLILITLYTSCLHLDSLTPIFAPASLYVSPRITERAAKIQRARLTSNGLGIFLLAFFEMHFSATDSFLCRWSGFPQSQYITSIHVLRMTGFMLASLSDRSKIRLIACCLCRFSQPPLQITTEHFWRSVCIGFMRISVLRKPSDLVALPLGSG